MIAIIKLAGKSVHIEYKCRRKMTYIADNRTSQKVGSFKLQVYTKVIWRDPDVKEIQTKIGSSI